MSRVRGVLQTLAAAAASHRLKGGQPISTITERAPVADERADALGTLVRRAQAGDRDAFDALYAATVSRVFAVCLRLTGDRAQAEQLTQDTYVTVWRRLRSFRGDSLFTSWLHRVTVNVVLQDRRASGRREARVMIAEDDVLESAPDRAPGPELHIDLERAIAQLPPGARAALVLHDIEGYTHQEIGDLMGIAAGTVKAQLHRARRLVQAALNR